VQARVLSAFSVLRAYPPNATNLLIVQGTIQFSLGILCRAALSYRWPWRAAADSELRQNAADSRDDDLDAPA